MYTDLNTKNNRSKRVIIVCIYCFHYISSYCFKLFLIIQSLFPPYSIHRYPQMQRGSWSLEKDGHTNECCDPAQIMLLVAHINFIYDIEKAMGTMSGMFGLVGNLVG